VSVAARHIRAQPKPDLRQLNVPTLIVWGTADQFFDLSWAYWLRDTIPGATDVVELASATLSSQNNAPRSSPRAFGSIGTLTEAFTAAGWRLFKRR
jgi:pimeloyl-ACP methyl ester carboxylesterase